jgi:hypothetical protein
MFKSKLFITLALLVCAFLLPATVMAKDQVIRPLKAQSHSLVAFTSETTTAISERGMATHLGLFTGQGEGTVIVPYTTIFYDTDWIAANGNVLNWKGEVTFTDLSCYPDLKFTVNFVVDGDASTGRFAGASGSFSSDEEFTAYYNPPNSQYPQGFWTMDYAVTGTVTY